MNGDELTATFDGGLDTGSTPAPGDFYVTVGTSRRDVAAAGVSITGSTVTLTLASAVLPTDTVKVRYAKPASNPLRDADNAMNPVATFTDQAVTNDTPDTTPPAFVSAAINGATLTLTFNEALDESVTPLPGAFRITVDGAARFASRHQHFRAHGDRDLRHGGGLRPDGKGVVREGE